MYSRDIRFLPTSDLEESFEVMACVSQGAMDAGTKMVVLDALATFVGEKETPGRIYKSFLNQEELEHHCSTPGNGCDVFRALKVCMFPSFFMASLVRSRGRHHQVALTMVGRREESSRPVSPAAVAAAAQALPLPTPKSLFATAPPPPPNPSNKKRLNATRAQIVDDA
jgi:hypothetical protein